VDDRSELAKERRHYIDLYEHAPVALMSVDLTCRIVEANLRAAFLLRLRREALIGAHLPSFCADDDRLVLTDCLVTAARNRKPVSCDVRFEAGWGEDAVLTHIDVEWAVDVRGHKTLRLALTESSAHAADAALRSAREREEKQQQQQQQEVRQRFSRIAVAGAELAETLDLETATARAAATAVPDVAFYCAVDLIGPDGAVRRAAFACDSGGGDLPLDPYAPHGAAMVIRTGETVVLNQPRVGELAGIAVDPASLRALVALISSYACIPLRAHGRTLGAMTFVRGCGRRYDLDDLALANELARRAAMAIDNARLYREAQEQDLRKDEFLAMLGHELRNPLAAVIMAASTLKRRPDAGPTTLKLADVVERQGGRLTRIVDDLLDVSRVTRGQISLRRERLVLCDVLDRAVESAGPLVRSRKHALAVTYHDQPLVLDADVTRLEQVAVNLLANAAKYTPAGGRIALESWREGGSAVISVRDNGIGIRKEALLRVFEPFTQLNPSEDRADRGLGIGLALVRSLVELHGGRVTADSAGEGMGSEFVVRLPLANAEAEGIERAPDEGVSPVSRVQRRKVLVAEDNTDLADLLGEKIQALGHEVRVANDGPTAIDTALVFHPEVMLIDIGLPGLTGYEVARRLRSEPALAGAMLIAVTGYGGVDTVRSCRAAGFDRHCTKPIGDDALQDALRAS
jgi:signal transduction histidine kinase